MNIITVFNEGDAVFVIKEKTVPYWDNCSMCGGAGVLYRKEQYRIANKEEVICPKCNGRTQTSTQGKITHIIESGTVYGINIHIESNWTDIEYEIDIKQDEYVIDTETFHDDKVFATKEDAEAALPKEMTMGYTQ